MDENRKKIKILHCSDVHLDAPFIGMTAEKADEVIAKHLVGGNVVTEYTIGAYKK